MKNTQSSPLARVPLPHPCDDVVDWSLNNGILDVTLKLTPQGSAVESNDDYDADEGDDDDDEAPETPEVRIDLGDDQDEDDDGGIPIF
jgi:hypothetical protein